MVLREKVVFDGRFFAECLGLGFAGGYLKTQSFKPRPTINEFASSLLDS